MIIQDFAEKVGHFARAVEQRDGPTFAASFTSLNHFSSGQRVVARGVAMFGFDGELFSSYREVANGTPTLWDLQARGEHLERASAALEVHYSPDIQGLYSRL